MRFFIKIW